MRLLQGFILLFFLSINVSAQTEEEIFIKKIFDTELTNGSCYEWLDYLSNQIGGRLSGSPQAAAAVEFTYQIMDDLGLDSVWLQPVMVPHWVRGDKEVVRVVNSPLMGDIDFHATALGNSIGTGKRGLTAEVIEVQSLDEVEALGRAKIEGKIVFYNRPMDPTLIRTFGAYGGAVDQRVNGAAQAAKYGAVATLVRSMTLKNDEVPHTGVQHYEEGIPQIPATAISVRDANLLSDLLKQERVTVYVRSTCEMLDPVLSYNVIGTIYGSEFPEEIIAIGGHLDAWDTGDGAHDDGAGCVQSIEVLNILKKLNYRPKRTLRCVMFMNEENGLNGGKEYWRLSNLNHEFHLAAIESDAGGFTPRGFSYDAQSSAIEKKLEVLSAWKPLFEKYDLHIFKGGSGADISGLKEQGAMLFGLRPDSQRYFDHHHAATDVFSAINKRELEMGAAAMIMLVYLIDKNGL